MYQPCYELIQSLKKFGFIKPEDVRWQQINLESEGKKFLKYCCTCGNLKREVILKNFSFAFKQPMSYFIGQCPRCDTIYWSSEYE